MNQKFVNALNRRTNAAPPIWMMRQAGRYHSHYQNLKKTYSFSQLCLSPKLAAEVAMGPIEDFDFDIAILFSDILFPLMAMGVDLVFEEFGGPKLRSPMNLQTLKNAPPVDKAIQDMLFQKEAMSETRKALPSEKSLIGFVGGPWTLFTFATQGTHKNGIREAKLAAPQMWSGFEELFVPLLSQNIQLQFDGGAEVVMVLDTASGELAFEELQAKVIKPLKVLAKQFPKRLGYYAKGISSEAMRLIQREIPELAGCGVDHRLPLKPLLQDSPGFLQGNFDPELIILPHDQFKTQLEQWWKSLNFKKAQEWDGWVCGLGHGLLPPTPEENVRYFVKWMRQSCLEVSS
ncbi:MAG: uroporphyrinogen decarboxylase family protein [Bdellovibrio sp.]|jgi:uroporphyrinogen decarboxylase